MMKIVRSFGFLFCSVWVRFAGFFGAFFAYQAFVTSFFPLYCFHLGFSPFQIAMLCAAEPAANLVGPPIITAKLYRFFSPRGVVLLCTGLLFLFFIPMLGVTSFAMLAIFYLLCMTAGKSVMICGNAAAVKISDQGAFNYGRARIWGSLGFIVAMYIMGLLVDKTGHGSLIYAGFVFVLLLTLVVFIFGSVFGKEKLKVVDYGGITYVFRDPVLRRSLVPLLIAMSFGWASFAVMFTYLSVYLEQLGWSGVMISNAWTIAVVAEIIVFFYFDAIERRVRLFHLFLFSLWVSVARWILFAMFSGFYAIVFVQLLHAVSFGIFYIASMKLINRIAPEGYEERAQGLFAAMGPGIGLLLGRLSAGVGAWCIGSGNLLQPLFWLSALFALGGALIAHRAVIDAETDAPVVSKSALSYDMGECP